MATIRQVVRQVAAQTTKAEAKGEAKAKQTATTTVTQAVRMRPELRKKLVTELRSYATLTAKLKPIKDEIATVTAKVRALREATGEKSLTIDGFKVTDVPGTTSVFDRDLFLSEGGDLELYDRCVVKKPKASYEKITVPGARNTDYE